MISSATPEIASTGIPIIEYSPGFTTNDLFSQMSPTSSTSFPIDLTFLQNRNGSYPGMFIVKQTSSSPSEFKNVYGEVYLNGFVRVFRTGYHQSFPVKTSTSLAEGRIILNKTSPGQVLIPPRGIQETILYASLSTFQKRFTTSDGVPVNLLGKDGKPIQPDVLKKIQLVLDGKNTQDSNSNSKSTPHVSILNGGLFITMVVFGLLLSYTALPYLWSLSGYQPVLGSILFGVFVLLMFVGFGAGYLLYSWFIGGESIIFKNLILGFFVFFVVIQRIKKTSSGFTNVMSPTEFPLMSEQGSDIDPLKIFSKDSKILETFHKNITALLENSPVDISKIQSQLQSLPVLRTKSQFTEEFYTPLLSQGNTIFQNIKPESWEGLRKHLGRVVGSESSSTDYFSHLEAFVYPDIPKDLTTDNLKTWVDTLKPEQFKMNVNSEEQILKLESMGGMIVLNGIILLLEVGLLVVCVYEILSSMGIFKLEDDEKKTRSLGNMIVNSIFALILVGLIVGHIWRMLSA
jgi:hypothetical protein